MTEATHQAPLPEDDPLALAFADHVDAITDMSFRRMINEDFARDKVDFNVEGLRVGEVFFPGGLTRDDVVVDIGSSSGRAIAAAIETAQTKTRVVTIEPRMVAFALTVPRYRTLLSRVQAFGERLPLKDNSAKGITAHNVVFRMHDVMTFFSEAKRVTEPGAYIAISTNDEGHANERHDFADRVAEKVRAETGEDFETPGPPAQGQYVHEVKELAQEAGGLEIISELLGVTQEQETEAVIHAGDETEIYIATIKFAANRTGLSDGNRRVWRRMVEQTVRPEIEAKIAQMKERNRAAGITEEAYFADAIRRGMVVLRNVS